MLICLVALTIMSVAGRTINAYGLGPIMGDFELVEHGTAFVVFCSLPLCQMRYGHVAVDVLSMSISVFCCMGFCCPQPVRITGCFYIGQPSALF